MEQDKTNEKGSQHSVTTLGVEMLQFQRFFGNTCEPFHHLQQQHLAKCADCKRLLRCRRNTVPTRNRSSYLQL